MSKSLKKSLIAAFAILLIGMVAGQVSATPVLDLFQTGVNQASDEDREYLIDRTDPNSAGYVVGQLDVGDSLRGEININTINSSSANVGGSTGNNEFTGIFQVMIGLKVFTPDNAATPLDDSFYTFVFVPDPAFEAAYGLGAIAAMYEDPTNNYASDFDDPGAPVVPLDDGTTVAAPSTEDVSVGPYATEEAFIGTATNGTLRMVLGFAGLAGEGGYGRTEPGSGFDNITAAFGLTSGSAGGTSNFGLNLLYKDPAWDSLIINPVTASPFGGTVDFALSQQLRGVSDLETPFEVSSNTNIAFNASKVPEPATMLLLGSGLIALGGAKRRKVRRS